MDPEELQSIADANGMPIQHFDGYSVMSHPTDGPMVVAHPPGARIPVRPPQPPVEGVPPLLARPPAPSPVAAPVLTPEMQRSRDAMRTAQAARVEAERLARIRGFEAEEAAQAEALDRQLGYTVSDPDQYGIVTRTYPGGRTVRVTTTDPRAFEAEARARAQAAEAARIEALRHTETGAGTRTFPDGATVTTDASGASVMGRQGPVDMARLREEMAGGPGRPAMGERDVPILSERVSGALPAVRDAATAAWEGTASPEVQAALSPATEALYSAVSPSTAAADYTPGTLPDGTPTAVPVSEAQAAAPVAPRRSMRGPGGRPVAPAPMTAPQFVEQLAGTPEAQAGFDQTIAGLARDPRDGGQLDLPGRQMLVESQRAGLAAKAAQTQQHIEAQAEQQRQQTEQDRQRAVAGATRAYQNAIARVADARIEPGRWFRDVGAAGTVGATIAVALGAIGNALTGQSTNGALEQINRAVEQDIDAQRSEIESGRAAADLQGNMVGIMRQEFSDRGAADEAAHAAMLQQAALQVQEHEAYLADDEARNHAEEVRAQMDAAASERWRAALDQQSQMDLRAAQADRARAAAAADDALARRRASGGTRAPAPVTHTQWQAFQAAIEGGMSPADAAHASFPVGSAPYANPPAHAPISGTERASLEDLQSALDLVTTHLPGDASEDIPGFGATGLFPRMLLSQEGRDLRAYVTNLRDAFGRDRTGANMPPSEVEQFNQILGSDPALSSDADLRNGIRIMQSIIAGHLHRGADLLGATDRDAAEFGGTRVE